MTLYEKLDVIADSYNPILLLISLVMIMLSFKSKGKNYAFYEAVLLITLMLLVYGFQFIDKQLNIWSSLGLDYSTHTAFSVAIVFFVLFKDIKIYIIISFICYIALMLFQKYHTISDILTTVLAISPLMYICANYIHRQQTKNLPVETPTTRTPIT